MDYLSNMFSLKGNVALVTGGSYGIGFTIAKALARAGAVIASTAAVRNTWTKLSTTPD